MGPLVVSWITKCSTKHKSRQDRLSGLYMPIYGMKPRRYLLVQKRKHQNIVWNRFDVIDFAVVSLLLTLNKQMQAGKWSK